MSTYTQLHSGFRRIILERGWRGRGLKIFLKGENQRSGDKYPLQTMKYSTKCRNQERDLLVDK